MLTFLSQSIRRFLNSTSAPSRAAQALALPATLSAPPLLPAPALRLISSAAPPDISIAPLASASAFVAGQGARIYSLEVFRRDRRHPPRPQGPRHAA
jgi:hypothetical protein